jgi:hypothetical protein
MKKLILYGEALLEKMYCGLFGFYVHVVYMQDERLS